MKCLYQAFLKKYSGRKKRAPCPQKAPAFMQDVVDTGCFLLSPLGSLGASLHLPLEAAPLCFSSHLAGEKKSKHKAISIIVVIIIIAVGVVIIIKMMMYSCMDHAGI